MFNAKSLLVLLSLISTGLLGCGSGGDEATGWTERADYSMKTTQQSGNAQITSETTQELRSVK